MRWSQALFSMLVFSIMLSMVWAAGPPTPPALPGTPDVGCTPLAEVCNGVDDDCDGLIDTDDPDYAATPADKQLGVCAGAVKTCVNGVPTEPSYASYSVLYEAVETTCDVYDNDCDGTRNVGLTRLSANQFGECAGNSQFCGTNGVWYNDADNYDPTSHPEVCDGLDNDCDNLYDQDDVGLLAPLLTVQSGVCAGYNRTCDGPAGWVNDYTIVPGYQSPEVLVCDGSDNDCDGSVDEGCGCAVGESRLCGDSDVGRCAFGNQSCQPDATWGSCIGAVNPIAEVCNALDDDCDGSVDEGLLREYSCGEGICTNKGNESCNPSTGRWVVLNECDPFFGAIDEVCNDDVDNDCDGLIDDDDSDDCERRPSGGGGGGGGGSSYVPPSLVEEEVPEETPTTEVEFAWEYQDSLASASLNISDFPIKRIYGNLPASQLPGLTVLSLEEPLAELPAGVPERYRLYRHLSFNDEVKGTLFEEFVVSFTVPDEWLMEQGVSWRGVNVLYPYDGGWRAGKTTYIPEEGFYQAELVNVPLDELLIVASSAPDEEAQPVVAPQDQDSGQQEVVDPFVSGEYSEGTEAPVLMWVVIIVVVLGGAVGGFFVARSKGFGPFGHHGASASSSPFSSSPAKPMVMEPSQPVAKPADPFASSQPLAASAPAEVPAIRDYVAKKRAAGVPDQAIRQNLLSAGWKASLVDQHLKR